MDKIEIPSIPSNLDGFSHFEMILPKQATCMIMARSISSLSFCHLFITKRKRGRRTNLLRNIGREATFHVSLIVENISEAAKHTSHTALFRFLLLLFLRFLLFLTITDALHHI